MTFAHFVKNLMLSYQTYFRLLWRTLVRSRNTQARLTVKRFFMMAGFFPLLFVVQTLHWLGFLLDEVFFRGYRSVEIRQPVFIVGVPRSGTTFLHRLLARDTERFTTFSLWELLLAPSVAERKFWLGLGRLDQLVGAPFARLIRWLERRVFAGLDNIHEISLSDEEEDYFLLVPIYACFLLILPFPFPDELGHLACFDDETPRADQDRIMDFYRACLKKHLYIRGTDKPFLSKNVSFSPMIRALFRAFPDSRIVGTVRNPINAVASHISSMMAGAAVFDNDTRGNEFRDQMIAVQRYAYSHVLETLSGAYEKDDKDAMIVRMEDLQSALAPTIKDLYERLGCQMTPEFEACIDAQDERQKGYKSGHQYDLSAYGLSGAIVYAQFSDVFDRFGYPRPAGALEDAGEAKSKPAGLPVQPNPGPKEAADVSSLRLLFLSDAIASRNGVGSYYADLVEHLNDHVAHAELVSPGSDTADYVHELTFPLPGDDTQRVYLPLVGRVWEKAKTVAPHGIIIPTPGPFGLLGFLMARYLGIPICAGYHTRYEKLTDLYWASAFSGMSRLYMKWLNRLFFRSSSRVVANSEEMIQEAARDGALHPEMIGTPIARAFLVPPFSPLSSQLRSVCYAGRLALEKNIRGVLDAARAMPHIRFTMAGDGPLRGEVAARAAEASNIEYVGWVSRQGVASVIDGADMLLLPSEVEAFGTIALEAMARRRLVLVSGNCGILNWPDLAPGVYAMDAGETLADAISRIASLPGEDRREKADNAHAAAKAFNDQTIGQWLALFESICLEKGQFGKYAKKAL